jgi:hypothetical protein
LSDTNLIALIAASLVIGGTFGTIFLLDGRDKNNERALNAGASPAQTIAGRALHQPGRAQRQSPPHQRRHPLLTLIAGLVAAVGFLSSVSTLWSYWAQSYPIILPPPDDTELDNILLQVRNQSLLFSMYRVSPQCDIVAYTKFDEVPKSRATVEIKPPFEINPGVNRTVRCETLPWITTNLANGDTISLPIEFADMTVSFDFETKIGNYYIERHSNPVTFRWGTSPTGHHFWELTTP